MIDATHTAMGLILSEKKRDILVVLHLDGVSVYIDGRLPGNYAEIEEDGYFMQQLAFYAAGWEPPNYPSPVIRECNECKPPHDGGVEGDYYQVGATFVDWSRGNIEIY